MQRQSSGSFMKAKQEAGVAVLILACIFSSSGMVFHLVVLCSGWVRSYLLFGLKRWCRLSVVVVKGRVCLVLNAKRVPFYSRHCHFHNHRLSFESSESIFMPH